MPTSVVRLSDLQPGQWSDCFALLAEKDRGKTRDGKPYYRVTFRDGRREVSFPIWHDSPVATSCRDDWVPGEFYKIRAVYRETNFGPILDIRRIRPITQKDFEDGFEPQMCLPHSRFEPQGMFAELLDIVGKYIEDEGLRSLVTTIMLENEEPLLRYPAAQRNHHAFAGGYLEHVLNVTHTASFLAERYAKLYPDMSPPLNLGLVVAGAVLHDIGKLQELDQSPLGTEYTPIGNLIGHILLGRDMVREAAKNAAIDIDEELLLRLEHIIVSHQRLPEWGAPKPPMTPEALLVHYADDSDAKFQIMYTILRDSTGQGHTTSTRNALGQKVYRGPS